jgi:hypothetical protein
VHFGNGINDTPWIGFQGIAQAQQAAGITRSGKSEQPGLAIFSLNSFNVASNFLPTLIMN